MQLGDVAVFKLGIGLKSGVISKINDRTVHVKLKDGSIVKRHIDKDVISSYHMPNGEHSDQIDQNKEFSGTVQS